MNGLKLPSIIKTNKLATLNKALTKGYIGNLSSNEIDELDERLKKLFQLD